MSPRPHRCQPRSVAVATLLSIALGSAGVAAFGGSASAEAFSELDLAWTGQPASVGNGEPVHGIAHVNLNDRLGEEGQDPNHVVTFQAHGGMFTRLPSACRTDGDPVSAVSADRTSVRCDLGRVRYGTAVEADFTVLAHGADGNAVSVDLTDGTVTAAVRPIPIVATPGLDVVFNEAQRVQAEAPWQSTFPIALALPAGSADLGGPITFDVVVDNKTSSNATTEIEPQQVGCVPLTSFSAPSSMPVTSTQAPVPSTCTVTRTSPGRLHVVVDGYRSPAAVDPPTTAVDGSALPTDRYVFAAFGLPLQSAHGVTPPSSSFDLTVTNVHATTTSGANAPEADTTNNTEGVTNTVRGAYATTWAGPSASPAPLDTRVVGGGGAWSATRYAKAGDQIVAMSTSALMGGDSVSTLPRGSEWGLCQVLDGPGAFDGVVMPSVEGNNAGPMAPLPTGTYQWAVSSAPLPASGTRDRFDCGSVSFKPVASVREAVLGGSCNCVPEERLTVADPASVTVLKLSVDPRALAQASGQSATPPRIGLHAGVRIASNATAAQAVWVLGSAQDAGGAWHHASASVLTPTPDLAYAGTNSNRDVIRLIGSRPYVDKSVSQPDVRVGDRVTYSVRTGAESNLGVGDASWTVTDTMPAGIDYVDGSASLRPASVDQASDGTTVLNWILQGPVNTDTVITYDGQINFTSGTRRNTAIASLTLAGGGSSSVQTDEDAADVVYAADGRTVLTKTAGSSTFAAGGANTWTLNLTNQDTVDQAVTDIIDVLPWNGDARGSAFHGVYAVDKVDGASSDRVFYATAKPRTIVTDPAAAANGAFGAPSAIWSPTAPTDRSRITAIRIVGSALSAGSTRSSTVTWHTIDGRAGDRFENIAFAKATHTRLQMIKSAATATVADGSRLQIAKLFQSATGWAAGDRLTYRITVHNPSGAVARAVVVDDLGGNGQDPATVAFSNLSQGNSTAGSATWTLGDLPGGATATADASVAIATATDRRKPLLNQAVVHNPSNPYEPAPDQACQPNNADVHADTDQCDITSVALPQLRIDKHADGVTKAGVIAWTLHVRLDGAVAVDGVVARDIYPQGIQQVTVTKAPTRGNFVSADGTWTIGHMAPGEVVSMSFSAHIAAPINSKQVNTATVESPDLPGQPDADNCQVNDGTTIDAALDADTDACDQTVTDVGAPPTPRAPRTPPAPQALPDTGGPSEWIGVLGVFSALGAIATAVGGRRRRTAGSHRA